MGFDFGLGALLTGFSGVAANLLWPIFRSRRGMLFAQTFGAFLFAAHYQLIGAHTAVAMLILAGIQALIAVPLGTRPGFRLVYLLTLPVIAIGVILSWQGVPSLFAAMGFGLVSLGRYQLDVIPFRSLLLACIPFWTVHNLMVGSVPGLASDAVSFASGAWMLWITIREHRRAQ